MSLEPGPLCLFESFIKRDEAPRAQSSHWVESCVIRSVSRSLRHYLYRASICYNMSGSFRTDYHIDFTGSTTGTADSSSGSAQLIIWRTRRHHAEDNATTRAMSGGRMPRNTRSLLMTNEREFWRRAWTRAGWTTVHLHPGRRAGGMSAGTVTLE